MSHSARFLKLAVAACIPVAAVAALTAPASAGGAAKAAGSIVCSYSSSMSFDPPLTPGPAGTAGYSKEVITIAAASLSGCSGSLTSGSLPTTGLGTKPLKVTMKGVTVDHVHSAGGCVAFSTLKWPKLKAKIGWTTSSGADASSKVTTNGAVGIVSGGGQDGYRFSGTAKGSFAGPVTINAYFDPASSAAIVDCVGGSGSVSSATIDPTISTISFG